LALYDAHLLDLAKNFTHITYTYLAQEDNQFVDALAKMASMINIPSGVHLMPLIVERRNKRAYCYSMEVLCVDLTIWYYDVYQVNDDEIFYPFF